MITFISGPMSGLPQGNWFEFMAMEIHLTGLGHEVINPAAFFEQRSIPLWEECMRRAIAELMRAEAVVVLDGWVQSRGALVEVWLAQKLNMPVYDSQMSRLGIVFTEVMIEAIQETMEKLGGA